jgi:hypothetical protein
MTLRYELKTISVSQLPFTPAKSAGTLGPNLSNCRHVKTVSTESRAGAAIFPVHSEISQFLAQLHQDVIEDLIDALKEFAKHFFDHSLGGVFGRRY